MREAEAREALLGKVKITRQLITLAKSFLLTADLKPQEPNVIEPDKAADQFAKLQGSPRAERVVIHDSANPMDGIVQAAGYISCTVAMGQALWELSHEGLLMAYGAMRMQEPYQGWTDVIPGSGGHSGSWTFTELQYVTPERAMRSPYYRLGAKEPLVDPDVFVLESGIKGAHEEVEEALRDAVASLRRELFRPAVTVLGKAMEGAWIELGLSLARLLPDREKERLTAGLAGDDWSVGKKITQVRAAYSRPEASGIVKASSVRLHELDSAVLWSDVVKEARNAIHFGVKPTTANTYEKVVVLFLEGAKCLSIMYSIKRTADHAGG